MQKMKSRKLWVTIATGVGVVLAQAFGVALEPEVIAGVVLLASSYIFGQGIVDKGVTTEQVKVAGDVGRIQVEAYARNLEAQLQQYMEPAPVASVTDLGPVPPIEG